MSGNLDIDPLPPINGEVIPPDEVEAIRAIVDLVAGRVRGAAAQTGTAMRDAHPKGHGCVRASFQVLDTVPEALRFGLFATPRRFDAWIRFSNGNAPPGPDSKGDGRGMAIKLMNVENSPSTTQDFILINHPVFPVRNVADYQALEANGLFRFFVPGLNPFHLRIHEAFVTWALLRKKVTNLLNVEYFSMSAYRCRDGACKYAARPVGEPSPYTDTSDANFLRLNLKSHLAEREAVFDFMVQKRVGTDAMPIEDTTIEWSETTSPFVPVARITIPPQSFDSEQQMKFCENLSFAPWHCLDDHRPLGGLNRLRRAIYEAISKLRHELNQQPRREPTDFSIG